MNIIDIILDIEDLPTPTERVISYSEVILYLINVKSSMIPHDNPVDWKYSINKIVAEAIIKECDRNIAELKKLISVTISHEDNKTT